MLNFWLTISLFASVQSLSMETYRKDSIINDYFHLKNVKSIVYVTCPEEEDFLTFETVRGFVRADFAIQVFKANAVHKFTLSPHTHNLGILLNLSCSISQNILRKSEENHYFSVTKFWLITGQLDKILAAFDSIFISPCSQVAFIYPDGDSYGLKNVYRLSPNQPLKIESVARRSQDPVIPRRRDLEGIYLKSGIVIAFPDIFTTLNDLKMGHIDTIAHVNYPIMVNMHHDLNYTFDLIQFDNYGWMKNHSFDGLMGNFERFEIDVGATAVFMRLDRVAILDFAAETINIRTCIMFRQPSLSAVTNIFTMPFAIDVWRSIIVFMAITAVAMILQLWHPYYPMEMGCMDCVHFVLGAICQQGFYVSMVARSGRILVFTTFITSLFLFTSYSANIVALLQSPSETIKTINDLTLSPMELGIQDTLYNKVFFNESSDPTTKLLYTKKIKPKGEAVFMRPHIGIERMRLKMFAYQVESQAGYKIISDTFSEPEKCGLMELEPFRLPMMSIPMRKNFPYKELFRQRLRWHREVGLIKREAIRWLPGRPKCEHKFPGFISVGITECRYTLKMFAFGMVICVSVFLVECAYHKIVVQMKYRREKQNYTPIKKMHQ